MKLKHIYLIFCILGTALPYRQFLPWLATNGLNLRLFARQLFANHISSFFALDVIISSVVLLIFIRAESSRLGLGALGRWLPRVAVFTVGVSLGLPLFLYIRELKLMQDSPRSGRQ